MPHRLSFSPKSTSSSDSDGHDPVRPSSSNSMKASRLRRRPSMLKTIGGFWKKTHQSSNLKPCYEDVGKSTFSTPKRPASATAVSRPHALNRHDSNNQDNLYPIETGANEDRFLTRNPRSSSSSRTPASPTSTTSSFTSPGGSDFSGSPRQLTDKSPSLSGSSSIVKPSKWSSLVPLRKGTQSKQLTPKPVGLTANDRHVSQESKPPKPYGDYENRWILNRVMGYRDGSAREKFYVTFAETPEKFQRVTVSVDYRNAPDESLESTLVAMKDQKDKNARIYEAVRDCLPQIRFFNTVTNLRLETKPDSGGVLVHFREDANEIIKYPARALFQHVACDIFTENELEFVSHLSGFNYRVRVHGLLLVKKEIVGPQGVDDFIYEVNALDSLRDSRHSVRLGGLVVDDRGTSVRAMLLSYASQGSLANIMFKNRRSIAWHRRERWGMQIAQGLMNVHEAGLVHGELTLAHIVIDADDHAQLIGINRRGCSSGWAPPELSRIIGSGQKARLMISNKTDLFQLGMVLWALAEDIDDAKRISQPLPSLGKRVPSYYRGIVRTCLAPRAQDRISAKSVWRQFQDNMLEEIETSDPEDNPITDFSLLSSTIPDDFRPADGYVPSEHHGGPPYSWNRDGQRSSSTMLGQRSSCSPDERSWSLTTASTVSFKDPPTLVLGEDGELLTTSALTPLDERLDLVEALTAEPVAIAACGKAQPVRIHTPRPASQGNTRSEATRRKRFAWAGRPGSESHIPVTSVFDSHHYPLADGSIQLERPWKTKKLPFWDAPLLLERPGTAA